jgi:CheY-like chemotaxis protein
MNILVAEDDRMSREMLTRMIASDADNHVVAAADGEEAWKLLCGGEHEFDVGIFDINMPKIDGFQLLERIRAMPSLRHLKAMLCTAAADRTTVERASGLAVSHYIVKPYNKAVILAKLAAMREELTRLGAESREELLKRLGVDSEVYSVLVNALLEDLDNWVGSCRYTSDLAKFVQLTKRTAGFRGGAQLLGLSAIVSRLEEVEFTLVSDSAASHGQQSPLLLSQILPIFEKLDEEIKRARRHLELGEG